MTLSFTVYGVAQPQGSAKAFIPKGWNRAVITSDNPKNKGWRQLVAEAASEAIRQMPAADREVTTDAVRLTVAFHLPRPKYLKGKSAPHVTRPDCDKLVRSIFDSLTKVVWRDDSQVVELVASKHYAAVDAVPCAVIRIEPVVTEAAERRLAFA